MVTGLHFVALRGNQNKSQSIAKRQYDLETFFSLLSPKIPEANFVSLCSTATYSPPQSRAVRPNLVHPAGGAEEDGGEVQVKGD